MMELIRKDTKYEDPVVVFPKSTTKQLIHVQLLMNMPRIDRFWELGLLSGVVSVEMSSKSMRYCNKRIVMAILFMWRTILKWRGWNQKNSTEIRYANANMLDFSYRFISIMRRYSLSSIMSVPYRKVFFIKVPLQSKQISKLDYFAKSDSCYSYWLGLSSFSSYFNT